MEPVQLTICFSSQQHPDESVSTTTQRSHRHDIGSSGLANPTLVASASATSGGFSSNSAAIPQIVPPLVSIKAASLTQQDEAYYSQGLRNMAQGFNLSEKAKTFVSKSHDQPQGKHMDTF